MNLSIVVKINNDDKLIKPEHPQKEETEEPRQIHETNKTHMSNILKAPIQTKNKREGNQVLVLKGMARMTS